MSGIHVKKILTKFWKIYEKISTKVIRRFRRMIVAQEKIWFFIVFLKNYRLFTKNY